MLGLFLFDQIRNKYRGIYYYYFAILTRTK
jgi:hypothetical protein